MAKIVEVPERTREVDPKVLKESEAIEKLLRANPAETSVGDDVAYDSRATAQSAGGRHKQLLIKRGLVDDPFELGVRVYGDNGKFRFAIALLSAENITKAKHRSAARRNAGSNGA